MKNILVYPLYKIKGRELEYANHKKLLAHNIKCIDKFNCVDEIILFEEEVDHWNEMIYKNFEKIEALVKKDNNVLFSEADTVFIKSFEKIFKLNKLFLFAKCNGSSQIDASLSEGFYLNAGLVYYPGCLKDNDDLWQYYKNMTVPNNISNSGCQYEVIVNKMFYSQFSTKKEGIEALHNFGLSNFNWRGLVAERNHSNLQMPSYDNIFHIHFLNMSAYIHKLPKWDSFWYEKFYLNLCEGVQANDSQLVKKEIVKIMEYYIDNIKGWENRPARLENMKNYIRRI